MTPRQPSRRQRQVLLVLKELGGSATEFAVFRKGFQLSFWGRNIDTYRHLRRCFEEGWTEREGAPGTYAYTITFEGERALAHLERVG